MKNFNSRAHVERDLWFSVMPGSAGKFQLTRSRGARLTAAEHWREDCVFQLTRSRGARHGSDRIAISVASFQLTRSRGARLPHGSDLRMEYDTISTHALTWSATFNPAGRWSMLCISTHALTWSATYAVLLDRWIMEFQLTRSRGARQRSSRSWGPPLHFNSRAHVERDYHLLLSTIIH